MDNVAMKTLYDYHYCSTPYAVHLNGSKIDCEY